MTGAAGTRARALQRLASAVGDDAARAALALLGAAEVEIARAPRPGLAMLRARDPFDTIFCAGEVLVTEATVRRGEARGWGAVVGDFPQRALLSALADLLGRLGDEAGLARLEEALAPEVARLEAERKAEARLVASTRVHFDLMPGR